MSLYLDTMGEGQDLVLVHGWGLHGGIFEPLTERLAEKYRVTVIDLPGHGHSTSIPAGGFDLDRLTLLLLDAAPKKANWIGWSLGGMASLNIALTHPERVQKLIMVSAQPQFVSSDDWRYGMIENNLNQFADSLLHDYKATLNRFLGFQVRGTDDERALLRAIKKQINNRPIAHSEALRLGLEILKNTNLRPKINQLHCPIQIILGERDTLVPVAAQQQLQTLLPNARIDVLPKAGHAPFLSHPDIFIRVAEEFLDS